MYNNNNTGKSGGISIRLCCINKNGYLWRKCVSKQRIIQQLLDLNAKWHNLHKSFQYLPPMPLVLQRTTRGLPVDYNGPGRHLHNNSCNLTHHFHRIASITSYYTDYDALDRVSCVETKIGSPFFFNITKLALQWFLCWSKLDTCTIFT